MQPPGKGKTLAAIFSSVLLKAPITVILAPGATIPGWRSAIKDTDKAAKYVASSVYACLHAPHASSACKLSMPLSLHYAHGDELLNKVLCLAVSQHWEASRVQCRVYTTDDIREMNRVVKKLVNESAQQSTADFVKGRSAVYLIISFSRFTKHDYEPTRRVFTAARDLHANGVLQLGVVDELHM